MVFTLAVPQMKLIYKLIIILLITLELSARADSYRPLDHLWFGLRDLPDQQNIIIFELGSFATLIALGLDQSVKDFFQGQNRLQGWEGVGNFWGSGIVSSGIGVGTLAFGLFFSKPHEVSSGKAHLEAFLMDILVVNALKYSVQRTRPDESDQLSFPSGHSSAAMTTAGSLMAMYGPKVGIPAIAMGSFTMLSRMASNKHHLSDTVFGATLGYILGRSYVKHHLEPETDNPGKNLSFFVLPYFEGQNEYGLYAKILF